VRSSAPRDRISLKDQPAIAEVCVDLGHEDGALEGVGSRPAQALLVRWIRQQRRHLAPGSWSSPSAHGQSTTSFSCTRIPLIVLDPAKALRIASNSLVLAPQLSCNLHLIILHPVPQRHGARKDTRTAKLFSSCHCRVVSVGPISPRVLPRLLLRRLRLHLLPRLPPWKYQYLRLYPTRCQRRHRYLSRPSSHPHPSYTSRSKSSLSRLLKRLLKTIHSSCAIPLHRLSFLSLRPHPHKLYLPLVHQAQPYHRLRLRPSHTLLQHQRAGSSGVPHHRTSKRHSHNHLNHPLRLDMRRHTPTPPCRHQQ
jgi:hypothetical protein